MTDLILFLILIVNILIFLQGTRWGKQISDWFFGLVKEAQDALEARKK